MFKFATVIVYMIIIFGSSSQLTQSNSPEKKYLAYRDSLD